LISQSSAPIASAAFLAPLFDQDRTRLFNNTGFFYDLNEKFRVQTNLTVNHEQTQAQSTFNKHYILGQVLESQSPGTSEFLLQNQLVSQDFLSQDYGALVEKRKGMNGSILGELTFLFSPTEKINFVLGGSAEKLYGRDKTGPMNNPLKELF
jgi:hypothetical protein